MPSLTEHFRPSKTLVEIKVYQLNQYISMFSLKYLTKIICHHIVPEEPFGTAVEKDVLDHNDNEDKSETIQDKIFGTLRFDPLFMI